MKFQPGDEILILHTNEEGKVIEIINNKMLLVEVRGVRFPVYTDQVDFPYFNRFTKTKQTGAKPIKKYIDNIPKEKDLPQPAGKEEGVWLSFIPKFTMDEFGDEVVDCSTTLLFSEARLSLTGCSAAEPVSLSPDKSKLLSFIKSSSILFSFARCLLSIKVCIGVLP